MNTKNYRALIGAHPSMLIGYDGPVIYHGQPVPLLAQPVLDTHRTTPPMVVVGISGHTVTATGVDLDLADPIVFAHLLRWLIATLHKIGPSGTSAKRAPVLGVPERAVPGFLFASLGGDLGALQERYWRGETAEGDENVLSYAIAEVKAQLHPYRWERK